MMAESFNRVRKSAHGLRLRTCVIYRLQRDNRPTPFGPGYHHVVSSQCQVNPDMVHGVLTSIIPRDTQLWEGGGR